MSSQEFPYSTKHLPFIPVTLIHAQKTLLLDALLDSGSTVNVLPHDIGIALGLSWETQTLSLELVGFLRGAPAYAVKLQAQIAQFQMTDLLFAWTGKPHKEIPLILGQQNFFESFDVHFYGRQGICEISL